VNDKVLFVDDDPYILDAFRRQFRKQFKVSAAPGGMEGLDLIQQSGPFAVVVADMRMPGMDGIQFLTEVRKQVPDTVRLMLTGNADQQTAMDAVNEGNVFRFLTKPCSEIVLANALEAGVEQYRLITAEKELLEGTLNGSIKLLTDILSLVAPNAFGRAMMQREIARKLAQALTISNTWDIELAAMLSNIAAVTVPPETLIKAYSKEPLSVSERQMVSQLPKVSSDLLANIPRLDKVARIVLYQQKNYDGTGFPPDKLMGDAIPLESRILRVVSKLSRLQAHGLSNSAALEQMGKKSGRYDPRVLQAAVLLQADEEGARAALPIDVSIAELRPGQVLISNIESLEGQLIFSAGHALTATIVHKLQNYAALSRIKEPIRVAVPVEEDEEVVDA